MNNVHLQQAKLEVQTMACGTARLDAGTQDSLLEDGR
jgi:hypothetical protein